ncbi:MerR family transcriptional regulator [Paenibacillus silvae]|uniref:MerR family transcriptional regulator n=1 Tax=Paenibacillus silvae TaxID=1325358 RepID=UPI0020039884|nr:MerR family transcriptional regulator [Paenibacillus silvae]MCK6078029.1 MerR family transcriptional regulator [Paenibacillus silvae]MCK6152228.1 MerR family transcriptional regulator [Paenibacillus silvae]MCK6270912.1 MerR family transcriptional regulator [Paenibacillus silvae]
MAMKVKEVSELASISVRTLHHYDEIGLLVPDEITAAGYRMYSDANLERLQQILFFKELGFSLKEIKNIIDDPTFSAEEALHMHKLILLEKRQRLDQMIATIDKTVLHLRGEIKMTAKEQFQGFDFSHNPYEKEARERWGDHAVNEANQKLQQQPADKQKELANQMNDIFVRLAALRHTAPDSAAAQAEIKQWYMYLNQIGNYTPAAFKGLGQMYVEDERFTRNMDQFGEGLAQFMCRAMAVFADSNE